MNKNRLHCLEYFLLTDLKKIDHSLKTITPAISLSERRQGIILNLQVSGGMDSMCLLQAFVSVLESHFFQPKNRFHLVVQHFNHGKRDEESDADENFVVEMCRKLGVHVYVEKTPDFSHSNNFQNAARLWRKKRARELGQNLVKSEGLLRFFIVTAHHARDHVETVLQHVLRGCSLAGLKGITRIDESGLYYRPFFSTSYEKIQQYSQEKDVPFRLDNSNFGDNYERNYIRKHIIPHLQKIKKSYQDSFLRLSESIGDFEESFQKIFLEKYGESEHIFLTKETQRGELYFFLKTRFTIKNKPFTLQKNSIENLLHEVALLLHRKSESKTIPLAGGGCVLLERVDNHAVRAQLFLEEKNMNSIKLYLPMG